MLDGQLDKDLGLLASWLLYIAASASYSFEKPPFEHYCHQQEVKCRKAMLNITTQNHKITNV